jgi:hypothetical protein
MSNNLNETKNSCLFYFLSLKYLAFRRKVKMPETLNDSQIACNIWKIAKFDHFPSIFGRSEPYTKQPPALAGGCLVNELPEHLANLVKFSLSTGLRKRNATELEWSQVDLLRNVAWIQVDQAKGRKSIHVSLNATAIEVLRKQVGKHPVRVFTYQGSRKANYPNQYQSLAESIDTCRYWKFPLAWFTTHLGELVSSKRCTFECDSGDGGLGINRNGETLCASRSRAIQKTCRSSRRTIYWHKFGTIRKSPGWRIHITCWFNGAGSKNRTRDLLITKHKYDYKLLI